VIPALVAAALLSAEPAGAAKPALTQAQQAIVAGKLPEDPARNIVLSKCQLCHTADYVTQQRLTPVQWQKTVEKMRKLGSPLTDDEVKLVSDYLGRHWVVGVPERPPRPVRAPANLVPAK
jgi:hypothetical protein